MTSSPISHDLNAGPFVDEVVFRVIANQDQRVLALQSGEIELHVGSLDSYRLETLETDPDIAISGSLILEACSALKPLAR